MASRQNGTSGDISAAQIRAARALLGWLQSDLAAAAQVPKRTILRLESGEVATRDATRRAVVEALEAAGIIFVAENGEGPGVRLRKGHP